MQTEFIHLTDENREDALSRAAEILRRGGLVAFPTETVYGLGANALDPEAAKKIYAAKGRPQDNPLITHIARFEELEPYCRPDERMKAQARALADAFWPGPMTMILPKTSLIPDGITGGLPSAAFRLPLNPIARHMIELAGIPVAAPSANRSGRPSPTSAEHVREDLDGLVDMILDGGPCGIGVESTVVSLCGDRPRLMRPGGVTLEQLTSVLGPVDVDRAVVGQIDMNEKVSSPGMKYRHYAPKAPVTVVEGTPQACAAYINARAGEKTGIMCADGEENLYPVGRVCPWGARGDAEAQAKRLFSVLRGFDETDVDCIYAACPPSERSDIPAEGLELAVMNRLLKAAGFQTVRV